MRNIRYKIFHFASRRQFTEATVVSFLLPLLIGIVVAGCSTKQNHIRLCESFTDEHELIGEDRVFSPGTLSLLLVTGQPIEHRIVRIKVFRLRDSERSAYGREVFYSVSPSLYTIRFDDAVSIADPGKYVVQISAKNNYPIAEAILDIVADAPTR